MLSYRRVDSFTLCSTGEKGSRATEEGRSACSVPNPCGSGGEGVGRRGGGNGTMKSVSETQHRGMHPRFLTTSDEATILMVALYE